MAADRRIAFAASLLAAVLLAAGPALAQSDPEPQRQPKNSAVDCTDDSNIDQDECRQDRRDEFGRLVVPMPAILVDLFPVGPPPPPANETDPSTGVPQGSPPEPGAPPPIRSAQAIARPAPLASQRALSGQYVPDEVLVTVDGDVQAVEDLAAAFNLTIRSQRLSELLGLTLVRYGIPDGRPVATVLAQLESDPRTRTRSPNHQLVLQQAAAMGNYAFRRIGLAPEDASGADIRIAVIDTAIDEKHPALSGVIADTFDAIPDTPVMDRDHGTSVAGLIAGVEPFRGIAPGAEIFHVRAFESGTSNVDILLAALDWAAERKVQIVNMSFVGPRNDLMELACAAARQRGTVLIASVGNNGPNAPFGYPAAYEGVIAVTAVDEKDALMPQANRGTYVFIAAPGVEMLAPVSGGADVVTGTSFATAIATGAAANLLRANPDGDVEWIAETLARTASDLGIKGRDPDFGYGLLNLSAAQRTPHR